MVQDGEDISGADEPSCDQSNAGGHRFENMIKSMLARLELNNSLAPIQEYGRHQKRAAKVKKKGEAIKKKAAEGEGEDLATADVASGEKPTTKDFQDDKYYDLDDDWIDDGEIDIQEDLGEELHLGENSSHFFSEQPGDERSQY